MHQGQLKVLQKLREKGSKGITFDDFNRGFALRSRISELRHKFNITTENEKLNTGSYRKRYFLQTTAGKTAPN